MAKGNINRKDLTGKIFCRLTVIEYIGNSKNRKALWKCKCECGNDYIAIGSLLTTGKVKSCGCLLREKFIDRVTKDEVGNKYNELTVIGKTEKRNNSGGVVWLCQCSCGKQIEVNSSNLRRGYTKSCGCLHNEIGKKYGRLTVIDEAGKRFDGKYYRTYWLCECECGVKLEVMGKSLRNGDTQSCGCLKSKGEEKINSLLIENNIEFKKEYSFSDLKGLGGKVLRFDFAIFKNHILSHLIEYDGKYHYEQSYLGLPTSTPKYDILKNEYCKTHNIKLLRFNRWDNLTIENLLI